MKAEEDGDWDIVDRLDANAMEFDVPYKAESK